MYGIVPAGARAIAVLEEEAPDEQRATCLIHIRRLVIKKQGAELRDKAGASADKRKLAFVVGLGEGGGCQKDAFTVLMDLLLPVWSPLRKGLGGDTEGWRLEGEENGTDDEEYVWVDSEEEDAEG